MRYSNSGKLTTQLRKLADLPVRRTGDDTHPRRAPIRQPTRSDLQQIIAEYLDGDTIRDIAVNRRLHRGTVSAALHRSGVDTRDHERVPVDLERAEQLHESGLTITEVAATLGIGRTTLVRTRRSASSPTTN